MKTLRFTSWLPLALLAGLALLASGCTPDDNGDGAVAPADTSIPASTPATATPNAGGATRPSPDSAGTPPPSDGMGVFVDSTEVLLLESYPVQVVLHVTGSLATPCHELAHEVNDDGSSIEVTLTASSDADSCAQVLEPFDERIALGSYASGQRTVWLNGVQVGEFDLGGGGGDTSTTYGRPFTLGPGETATLEADGTRVRFEGVEDDSRCPRDVQCIRAGDATVVLAITFPDGTEQTARVLVDPSAGTASVDGTEIRVTELTPLPVSTGEITPGDYTVTLVVER